MECTKIKYNNKNIARKQANFFYKKNGVRYRAYGCHICNKVHLTSKCKQDKK